VDFYENRDAGSYKFIHGNIIISPNDSLQRHG
jgi:hypothetical protein